MVPLFDRQVRGPEPILKRIVYGIKAESHRPQNGAEARLQKKLEQLFKQLLDRYLKGTGLPNHPQLIDSGVVSQEEIRCAKDDSGARARAFLRSMSAETLLPVDSGWKIKVRNLNCWK